MADEKKPEADVQSVETSNQSLSVQTIDKLVQASLRDILPRAKQKQIAERLRPRLQQLIVSVSKYHSGPLPSVETVQGYEAVSPGSFERIIAMAEKDQGAFITSTTFKAKKDASYRIACLISGLVALGLILATILYLALQGHETAALGAAGLGAAGIISAFVNARLSSRD